ncbi:MAG: ABC transporter substrate-binding protein, partial [Rhodospirillaceae bacterium]
MMRTFTRFLGTGLAAAALMVTAGASAGTLDGVEGRHGIAMHGDLKYPPGFKHFAYVNPDAPKGGKVRLSAIGTFDSFNPFIVKGNAAGAAGAIYNSLTSASADEAFTRYGELAEEIYMPDDRTWVAFKIRKEARWHDGKPITQDDVIWTFDTLRK